MDIVVKS
jgi:hypothetical protein